MSRSNTFELSPRELARALWRHKGKATLVAAGIFGVVLGVTLLGQETYQSEAKLFVRLGRESVTLDPVATTGQVVQISDSRESEINSVIDMLQSRSLHEQVVDVLGPETVLGHHAGLVGTITGLFQGPAPAPGTEAAAYRAAKLRDNAILQLGKNLDIYGGRKSSVINVSCKADSPKLAQEIVSRLIGFYLESHGTANETDGSEQFFAAQRSVCRTQLDATAVSLRDLKNKLGVATLADQHLLLSKRIGLLQEQLATTASDADAAETAVAEMKSKHADLPETVVTAAENGYPNHAADLMRSQLYGLQIKEQELRSLYNDDFPQVVEIHRQVQEAQEILDDQVDQRKQTTEGLNQSREQLHVALLNEEARARSLRSKAASLQKYLEASLAELHELNDGEVKVAQLERELQLADANFRKYSEHLEQARIDHALHDEQISNINIVQPASYVMKPIWPKKLLNLAVGLALAMCGAIGVALAAELSQRPSKSPQDVATDVELPVLVSIPRFSGQHQNGFTHGRTNDLINR